MFPYINLTETYRDFTEIDRNLFINLDKTSTKEGINVGVSYQKRNKFYRNLHKF